VNVANQRVMNTLAKKSKCQSQRKTQWKLPRTIPNKQMTPPPCRHQHQ
jgi:hypothetical protein